MASNQNFQELHLETSDIELITQEPIGELLAAPRGVPIASGIDISKLVGPNGEPPFLVDLPILEYGDGFKSRNNRPWRQAGAINLQETIMSQKLEGQLGHMKPEDRGHQYTLPALWWIGAQLEGTPEKGIVKGKAFVPSSREDVRDYFRTADRIKAKVGVSVYGMPGKNGTDDAIFESIDIGHPTRLGIANLAQTPEIVAELENNPVDPVTTPTPEQIQEMLSNSLVQLTQPIAELFGDQKLGPADLIKQLVEEVRTSRRQVVISEFHEKVRAKYEKTPAVATYILELVDDEDVETLDQALALVEKRAAKPTVAKHIQELVTEAGGPAAAPNGSAEQPKPGTVASRYPADYFTKSLIAESMGALGLQVEPL